MVKAIRQACLNVFWAFLRLTGRKPKPGWTKSKKRNNLDFA